MTVHGAARSLGRHARLFALYFGQYAKGLADLWVAQDGKRYGLPKDWDTIAIFYNKKMLAAKVSALRSKSTCLGASFCIISSK